MDYEYWKMDIIISFNLLGLLIGYYSLQRRIKKLENKAGETK